MRLLFIFSLPILFWCCNDEHKPYRTNDPVASIVSEYQVSYRLYINDELTDSSNEGYLDIKGTGKPSVISFLTIKTHLFDGIEKKYKDKPTPGSLYRLYPVNSTQIPVTGMAYDVQFDDRFIGYIEFYGLEESTMFSNISRLSDIDVSINGWMKEREYHYNEYGSVSYNCEILITFSSDGKDFRIVIDDAPYLYSIR